MIRAATEVAAASRLAARSSRGGGSIFPASAIGVVHVSDFSLSLGACREDDDNDGSPPSRGYSSSTGRMSFPPVERIRTLSCRGSPLGSSLRHGLSPTGAGAGGAHAPSARPYHSTPKNEILPLVALAIVGFTARYSYKALQRMDAEWEEYEEAMREYKANGGAVDVDFKAKSGETSGESAGSDSSSESRVSRSFRGGVMGVDLGTVNLRVSHAKGGAEPGVVVDREGGRSTPALVYFEDGSSEAVPGRLAAAKAHERSDVLSPHGLLLDGSGNIMNEAVMGVVRPACSNALEQVLPPSSGSGSGVSHSSPLFSVDPSSTGGGYNVRPAFAYPPIEDGNTGEWDAGYVSRYQAAVSSLSSPESAAAFVPEPVAAVAGARKLGVLPSVSTGGTVMVLDVGGTVTSASLVAPSRSEGAKHEGDADVVECLRLPALGGESLVEALVNHVSRDFFGVRDASEVQDGMALQRLHDAARGAVMEVSGGKNRVQINVPYLTVDEKMQPRHLDMGVSADVLEAEVDELVQSRANEYTAAGVLSKNMPQSKDLSSALSSLIMRVLEEGETNPFALEAVLVVGGGSRSPIVQRALRKGLASIAGEQFVADKMIIPKGEMIEELVVLGAAVVGGKS